MNQGTIRSGIAGALLAALVAMPFCAQAESKNPDQEFYDKAAVAGMFEVKSSELALQKGTAAPIKSFAQMMVTDHTAANDKLKSLAQAKNVTLPTALDKDHQKKLDKLAKTESGKDFDEQYADLMEDGHDDAVKLFEKAAKDAKDPEVKTFAKATLPTLKQHSEAAEALDRKDVAP